MALPLEFSDRTRIPSAEVAGDVIVRELPEHVGAVVFSAYRLTLAFAQRSLDEPWFPSARLRAWEESMLLGDMDQQLQAPLAVLVGELVNPRSADIALVSRSCWCIVEWALESYEETALAFGELAALCWPTNGRHALVLGRLYRNSGYPRHGEVWFRRAARLASGAADWEVAVLSTSGLGMLFWDQANFRRAKELLRRAQRMAQRRGLRTLEGEVLHNRLAVAITAGELEDAESFARAAFERYEPGHSRIPALAYDVAYLWLSKGYAAPALNTFQALLPHFRDPERTVQVLCAMARAGGMIGDREIFESAFKPVLELAERIEKAPTLAAALIDLALGAISLHLASEAADVLERATRVASQMNQSDMLIRAEEALTPLRQHQPEIPLRGKPGSERETFTRRLTGVLERLAPKLYAVD